MIEIFFNFFHSIILKILLDYINIITPKKYYDADKLPLCGFIGTRRGITQSPMKIFR